jgi:Ca2+-binding RTX toxin-like protein
MKRPGLRLGASIVAAAIALLALAGAAQAAVTADPAVTILYVKGDAEANQIQVDCSTQVVLVNGAPAADGHASCSDLKKLEVFGFAGDDTISLTGFPKDPDAGSSDEFYGEDQPEIAALGGDGNDNVAGDATGVTLSGGAGNDIVRGVGAFGQAMIGGPGNDTIDSSAFFSVMFGGPGADRLQASGQFAFALGGPGADSFAGSSSLDFADGGPGPDKLAGNGGNDLLAGQGGGDSIFGGGGSDLLVGGGGRDRLRGGPGDDESFQANPSHDELKAAAKHLFGGGSDIVLKAAHRKALGLLGVGG